jgi:polyisoprenoid-binding protein YceI
MIKTTLMKHTLVVLIFVGLSSIATAQEVRYKSDLQKSKVLWYGYYLFSFGEHYGSIDLTQGELLMKGNELVGGNFEIDMLTIVNIDMGEDGKSLADHLKSEDFFAVDQFPKAQFKIEKTKKMDDVRPGDPDVEITGLLTLKGVAHPITFPAFLQVNGNEVIAKAKLKFDRTKWNVRYGSGKLFGDVGDNAISDAIGLDLNLKFIKQ